MLRTIVIIFFLASSCEEQALRDQNRPTGDDAEVPGYEAETIETVKATKSATITIGKSTIAIPEDGLGEDAEVRLRTLKSKPEREEVASLGDAKGDVVEVTMYNKGTNEIYASSVLDLPYGASQVLSDVSDEANLKYVVISAPGTDDEQVQVLSRKAITSSAALTAADLTVSIELSTTHVIFYAVESSEVSGTVIILDSGKDASNDSGGTVSTSSTSSSSTSSSSSSSSGSSIDCSGKGFDPDNEDWIAVPANAAVGQSEDFCVMKYEAKNDGSGNPVSKPSGTPWVEIDRDGAIAKCASLGEGVYELITNEAWQTIARNIETAQSPPGTYLNWSGDPPSPSGSNSLNRGNSNQDAALVADPDDANGCAGITSNGNPDDNCASAWHVNKRTHTLSNGEVIWDLAGNVWEWTSSILKSQGTDGKISQNLANVPDATTGKLKWGPEGDYSSKNSGEFGGLGLGYLSGSGGAVLRGGYWSHYTYAGAFAAHLNFDPSNTLSNFGFRCVSSGGP